MKLTDIIILESTFILDALGRGHSFSYVSEHLQSKYSVLIKVSSLRDMIYRYFKKSGINLKNEKAKMLESHRQAIKESVRSHKQGRFIVSPSSAPSYDPNLKFG